VTTALEFVENIDDVIYVLCRRGFFSRRLKIAANQDNVIQCSSTASARRIRKWSKRVIRVVYFSVMFVMCAGLSVITHKQPTGEYGCTSIVVQFGDEVWEDAWVTLDSQCSVDSDCNANQKCFQGNSHENPFCHEKRLLIFSHFNGLYTFNGIEAERPKYVEMNKEKGDPYKSTTPAGIKYCEEIKSWVFFHRNIQTSLDSKASNECQWLLRSEETEDFDLVELSTGFWRLWDGKIVVSIPLLLLKVMLPSRLETQNIHLLMICLALPRLSLRFSQLRTTTVSTLIVRSAARIPIATTWALASMSPATGWIRNVNALMG